MTIYIQRHGLRLDIVDKLTGNNRWKTSSRFCQNFNDSPLFDNDELAIHKNAKFITDKIDHIYTSPATRCIETSLILNKYIGAPISIEYGLMESQLYSSNALNDTFIHDEMAQPVRINGMTYERAIDDLMMPQWLTSRFPSICTNDSIVQPEDVAVAMDFATWAMRIRQLYEIWQGRHENIMIVCHAATITNLAPFIMGQSLDQYDRHVNGNDHTGTLAVCRPDANICVYQNGDKIYEYGNTII